MGFQGSKTLVTWTPQHNYWSSHGVTRFFLKRMIMLNPLFRIQKYALLNPRTIFLHTSFGRRLLLVVFLVVKFLLDLKKSRKKSHKIIGHFNKKVGKTHIRPWKQCNLYSLDSRQWWFLLIRRSEQKVKHSFFLLRMGCVSALYTEEMLKTSGTREPSLLPRFWYSPWFHPLKNPAEKMGISWEPMFFA